MATVSRIICDDCGSECSGKQDGRYEFRMLAYGGIKGEDILHLPFKDLCEKCAKKRIKQLGGPTEVWTQDMLKKMKRPKLREIAKDHGVQGRLNSDLINSLTGKPIDPPEPKEK